MTESSTYHHGNLRQALLQEAINEIRLHGVDKLSLRALARTLGVSQTAPYRHFSDKNSLLSELATEAFHELANALRTEIQPQRSASDNTYAAGMAYLNYGLHNPEKYRLMFSTTADVRNNCPTLCQACTSAFDLLVLLITRGQQEQVFASGDITLMAHACWSSLHGFVLLHIDALFASHELPATLETMKNSQLGFTLAALNRYNLPLLH